MPLEVIITVNAYMEDCVHPTALSMILLSVPAETELPVPAMDVQAGQYVILINTPIVLRMPIWIIGLF